MSGWEGEGVGNRESVWGKNWELFEARIQLNGGTKGRGGGTSIKNMGKLRIWTLDVTTKAKEGRRVVEWCQRGGIFLLLNPRGGT